MTPHSHQTPHRLTLHHQSLFGSRILTPISISPAQLSISLILSPALPPLRTLSISLSLSPSLPCNPSLLTVSLILSPISPLRKPSPSLLSPLRSPPSLSPFLPPLRTQQHLSQSLTLSPSLPCNPSSLWPSPSFSRHLSHLADPPLLLPCAGTSSPHAVLYSSLSRSD
eukprot:TRINITY_DN6725_c0_g1_i1.p1 TRINITY_DN6725_c0_g1~~TRINITY_DN6725_c0_g1_i1.p1  ORF type:complete len:168 (+),score=22.92 TRINITY_DN6725_c0_g1_i1:44-547(+)